MKSINGYNNVKAITGDYDRLPAGGYVCRIVKVEDVPEKEYLKIYYDILDGDYAKYWEGVYERNGKQYWPGSFVRSYKETAIGFFKGFIATVDESNGTNFGDMIETGFDEQKLLRQRIGLVIGYEEYRAKSGEIKTRSYVARNMDIQKIADGDYTVPALKEYTEKDNTFTTLETADADLPF